MRATRANETVMAAPFAVGPVEAEGESSGPFKGVEEGVVPAVGVVPVVVGVVPVVGVTVEVGVVEAVGVPVGAVGGAAYRIT